MGPLEKRASKRILQFPDADRDGRLRQMQMPDRSLEGAVPADPIEGLELREGEAHELPSCSMLRP
jgi:hypothetical protein